MLCLIFGCQQPVEEVAKEAVAEVASLSDEDMAAIRASTEEYSQAWRSADWVTLAALHTEDAMVQGRDAIQASNEASPVPLEANLTIVEIDGRGDLAYVQGTYSSTVQPEGAPEPIQETGKYIEIRRKQEDGSWLITIDIWNSDLPLPE